jgi:hypothetical protein
MNTLRDERVDSRHFSLVPGSRYNPKFHFMNTLPLNRGGGFTTGRAS